MIAIPVRTFYECSSTVYRYEYRIQYGKGGTALVAIHARVQSFGSRPGRLLLLWKANLIRLMGYIIFFLLLQCECLRRATRRATTASRSVNFNKNSDPGRMSGVHRSERKIPTTHVIRIFISSKEDESDHTVSCQQAVHGQCAGCFWATTTTTTGR